VEHSIWAQGHPAGYSRRTELRQIVFSYPLLPEHKRIILDLTELTRMGSLGLGTLARLYLSAHSAGCSLELMNLAPA